jgi:SusD family.
MKQFFLLCIFTSTILFSCKKDFLDSTYNGGIIREEYVTSLQTCNEYLNGIYVNLSSISGEYTLIYPELVADNVKPQAGKTILTMQYNWQQQASEDQSSVSSNLNVYSYNFYRVITSCNFLIQRVSDFIQEDPALGNSIKGQCYAIRALLHFQLVNFFAQSPNFSPDGSHPGIVYSTSPYWYTTVNKRNTVAEVYQKMSEDLKNAISLLPDNSINTLYFGKAAAKSLLARVSLFKEDYFNAKQLAREVSLSVPLMQASDGYPNDMYKMLPPNKTEVMFQLVPGSSVSLGHTGGGIFSGAYYKASKLFMPTADMSALLSERTSDVRKVWVTNVAGVQTVTKFPSSVISDVTPADASYFQAVIRSSEMFLTAAECYAKLNMEDSARFFLDALRKRADKNIAPLSASGAALLDSVYKERRKELSFEGLRMYDLLRWKKGVTRSDPLTTAAASLPYPSNSSIAPIPVLDVKLSGLSQNQGY